MRPTVSRKPTENRDGFLPYAAPSTGAFERFSPLGAPQGCGALPKGQEAPFGNPVQKRGAQDKSAG